MHHSTVRKHKVCFDMRDLPVLRVLLQNLQHNWFAAITVGGPAPQRSLRSGLTVGVPSFGKAPVASNCTGSVGTMSVPIVQSIGEQTLKFHPESGGRRIIFCVDGEGIGVQINLCS